MTNSMVQNTQHYGNHHISELCFVLFLLFLINPIVGIICSCISVLKKKTYSNLLLVALLLAFYLSALNTTKVIESDLAGYVDRFLKVSQYGYIKTLTYQTDFESFKDVGYGTFVYISYYVLFGNYRLFIFVITFLIYILLFMSIIKMGKQKMIPIYLLLASTITIAFFSQFFTLTAHLIRQMLASSVFIYALTFKDVSHKKYYFLCLLSFSFHSSLALVIILSFLPFFNRRLKKKEFLMLLLFTVSFVSVFSVAASYLLELITGGGQVVNDLGRVASMKGLSDGGEEESSQIIFIGISAIMLIICMLEYFCNKVIAYPVVINLCIVWSLLIMSLSVSPLLQYRFFYILYFFLPFILFLYPRNNYVISKVICLIVSLSMVIRFFMLFESSAFHYTSVVSALLSPYFLLVQF